MVHELHIHTSGAACHGVTLGSVLPENVSLNWKHVVLGFHYPVPPAQFEELIEKKRH